MWVLAALTAAGVAIARRFAGPERNPNQMATRVATPAVLTAALFVAALGVATAQTVVLAVLPVFGRQLGVSAAAVTWLLTGFMLAAAVATPVAGRLGNVHGHRRVMLVSLGVLVAGSVLAAVADHTGSFAGLLLGRVVQGLSAGVFPVAFGLARRTVPASSLTGVVAGLSAMFGVGGALGMVLAGPLAGVLGTPVLFWLCAALGLVALAGAAVVGEPEERAPAATLDVGGALLLSVVLVAVLLVVSQGRTWEWDSAATLATAAVAIGAAVAFVLVELRVAAPVVDLRLLRRRPIAATNLATLVVSVGMFAAVTLIPQLAQVPPAAGYGLGATAAGIGLLIAPMAVIMVIAAPLGARLTARMGGRATFQVGALLAAAALVALALAHDAVWEVAAAGAVLGLAYGLAFAALGTLIVGAVRPDETGAATGINTILRTVGGAAGAQVAAAIITPAAGLPTEGGFTIAFLVAAAAAILAVVAARAIPRSSARDPTFTGSGREHGDQSPR
ncbi:MFS transporter [Pseudonocardia sp. DSM 110487]|uniref:MFS transporter n=1 Tax=Pseudonocardia sp. DSM 110487 TaxID=2865833 RepID=UPI001C69E62D|nr:MFS transporter [Pseudonocardia sp. DSM 110487]QYN32310.1 MFS transporter [Pseudonocardia sp. DSM 110487]